jgi:tRNA(Ile)-lysidine synthase
MLSRSPLDSNKVTARSHSSAVGRLRQGVRAALRAEGVVSGDAVVVACSHGPDSLALADAVLALRRPMALGTVTLCYVDHGLREEARDEWARVRAFAYAHAAHATLRRVSLDRERGGGVEEAARHARYAALHEVADAVGASWILVGHTASDQAETVILRLLRGAGPLGLAGIPPRRGRILRPLLGASRRAVEAYLAARGLTASEDESNATPEFTRNRVRAHVLPTLRAENPSIDEGLARTARAMRELSDGLEWASARAEALAEVRREPDVLTLDAATVSRVPRAVAKRLLARVADELGASLEAVHLDAALELAAGPGGGSRLVSAPNIALQRVGPRLELRRRTADDAMGIRMLVDVRCAERVRVRVFRPGDRMRPLRLGGRSRKLSDLYADARVPRPARAHAVVVERIDWRLEARAGGPDVRQIRREIIWAEHIGPSFGADVHVTLTRLDPTVNTESPRSKGHKQ